MNQILQLIGTFASIISVPLAIYFYLKTIDGKYEKVRKELISLFSNYIGSGNKLSSFYLSSVINVKLKENNLKKGSITEISIVEDLIVEIISNALLSNETKESILQDLEKIINPVIIPSGKLAGTPDYVEEKETQNISEQRKQLAEALRKGDNVIISEGENKNQHINRELFKVIISWVGIIASVLSLLISTGQVTELFSIIDLTNPLVQIVIGVISSIFATFIAFLLEKKIKKK